jgi:hypothetical protein
MGGYGQGGYGVGGYGGIALSTTTGETILNWCSIHAELLPLLGVGGYSQEPGLSICNDALSEIINDTNDWKYNRVELDPTQNPLITCTNKQDYLFAGASAFVLAQNPSNGQPAVESSGVGIDLAANDAITVVSGLVTVNCLEPHRFSVGNTVYLAGCYFSEGTGANYNATYADNGNQTTWGNGFVITSVTAMSFSFAAISGQSNGDIGGAPGFGSAATAQNGGEEAEDGGADEGETLPGFGWLSGADMLELNNNSCPPNYRQLKARRTLPRWNKCADPEQVAVISNYGNGVLRVRFIYIPSAAIWAVGLVFQAAKPLITSVSDPGTFAPIPDNYDWLIRQAVLYRCYRYLDANSSATVNEFKKLQADIQKALGVDQAEESNVYIEPDESITDLTGPYYISS